MHLMLRSFLHQMADSSPDPESELYISPAPRQREMNADETSESLACGVSTCVLVGLDSNNVIFSVSNIPLT